MVIGIDGELLVIPICRKSYIMSESNMKILCLLWPQYGVMREMVAGIDLVKACCSYEEILEMTYRRISRDCILLKVLFPPSRIL